jgi:hypothetical protein
MLVGRSSIGIKYLWSAIAMSYDIPWLGNYHVLLMSALAALSMILHARGVHHIFVSDT